MGKKKIKEILEDDVQSKSNDEQNPTIFSTEGSSFTEDTPRETIENDYSEYINEESIVPQKKKLQIKQSFSSFMSEEKAISRWVVLRIGLIGMLTGAILGFMVAVMGIVKI